MTPTPDLPGSAALPESADEAAHDAIPMLTDVVQIARYSDEQLPEQFDEVDWTALALRVRENVMDRLLRRTDLMMETQLQDTLRSIVDRTTETLAIELHDALNRMVRDLVSKAVSDELTRVHAEMARRETRERARPAAPPSRD